jgi:fatty acid kinase
MSTVKELLNELLDEDSEILTVITGEDATDDQVEEVVNFVEEKYPDCEIETHIGKQPLYNFIFSVE